MQEWLNQYKADKLDELPDFQGGAIGFISYDYARYIEKLPNDAQDDLQIPDIHFSFIKNALSLTMKPKSSG